jgi:hypothetical protein
VPRTIDLEAMARSVAKGDPPLAGLLRSEAAMRSSRRDADWWRQQWSAAACDLERRTWLFRALTAAQTQVVIHLAPEIDKAVEALTPNHFRAMEAAVRAFGHSSLARQVVLQDALRRAQVAYSGRALWLLRMVATEGSIEQIDKKLIGMFGALLVPGMGDRRAVMRVLGDRKTIPIDSLEGSRSALLAGDWAGSVRLGALKGASATQVLNHPEGWPLEVVGRAIQQAATQLAKVPSVGKLAERNHWFDPPDEG